MAGRVGRGGKRKVVLPNLAEMPPPGTPLAYMLQVMNDETADPARRDKMAIAAVAYVHGRVVDELPTRTRQRKDAAEKAADKFAVPDAPKLAIAA